MTKLKTPEEGKVERISSKTGHAEKIEKMRQEFERPVVRRQTATEEQLRGGDKFRDGSSVPGFLRAVERRQASSVAYRSFKLPGTDRMVSDLRDGAKQEAVQKEATYNTREGRLAEAKSKSFVNYLGDRSNLRGNVSGALESEISRLLSEFEKLLIERFEKGKTVEQKSEDGKPHFKAKTDSEWHSFFSKFVKRTVWKDADIGLVNEFIFRGLASLKKGDGKFAMLIGDLIMSDGQNQKFARLKVLSDIMKALSGIEPGSALEAEVLKKFMEAGELKFLALAHKHAEKGFQTAAQATKGLFGELKMEEHVARELGIRGRRSGRAYGGPIKWGGEGSDTEDHQFVPIGFWERQKRGRYPFIAPIIYTLLTIVVITAIILAIKLAF